jgi:hypothetical protein
MRQARNEFGEDVMLVTSRIAAPEFRYLGDYEVVFAVDGSEAPPVIEASSKPEPVVSAFGEFMRQQLAPEEAGTEHPDLVISRLHSTFVDLGIDPTQAELLVALIRSCTPRRTEPAIVDPLLLDPVSISADSPPAFEIGAVELGMDIAEPSIEPSVIQTSVEPMAIEEEREDLRVDRQPDRRPRQKSSVSGKAGIAMMLVALGFGMFRPVRVSK